MLGNQRIMGPCKIKSLPLGVQGDNFFDIFTNSHSYRRLRENIEIESRSGIRSLELKSMRILYLIDQQSQYFVRVGLLESVKADSCKIRGEVRELLLDVLALFSNSSLQYA